MSRLIISTHETSEGVISLKPDLNFLHIDGRYLRILLALPFEDNIISRW